MLSPCVHVCKIEGSSCIGCGRTLAEIGRWKDLSEAKQVHLMTDVLPFRQVLRHLNLDDSGIPGRRLHRKDAESVWVHFLALESEARRSRFGYTISDEALQTWLEHLDWEHTVVWGLPHPQANEEEGLNSTVWRAVGVLSPEGRIFIQGEATHRWEVGLSVLKDARRQGLGSQLIEGAISVAKRISPHGQMILYTQKDCTPIFRLVLRHGGRLQSQMDETVGLFEW